MGALAGAIVGGPPAVIIVATNNAFMATAASNENMVSTISNAKRETG